MVSQSKLNLEVSLFSLFLFLCIANCAFAQVGGLEALDTGLGGGNSIVGTVLGPSGHRLGVRVRVRLETMTRGDRNTTTDEYGNFTFRGVPSGNYTIVINNEKDFEPLTHPLDIIQVRGAPPQVYNLNLRLTSKAAPRLKPGVIDSELANVPKKALDLYTKGLEFVKNRDFKSAIEQFQLSIVEYPNFMYAYNELGVQYLRLNDLKKANESFQSALKIKPDAFAPLMNRGIVLVHMKQFEEAEPALRKALKIEEKSPVCHYFLGQALANLGRFDEAEKELVSAITLGGDEMKEAHRFLAIIYSAQGDKKRASDELETYLRLVPTTPDAEQLRNVIRQLKDSKSPASAPSTETKPSP